MSCAGLAESPVGQIQLSLCRIERVLQFPSFFFFGKGRNSCGVTQDCQAPFSSRWREALGFHQPRELPVGSLAVRRA